MSVSKRWTMEILLDEQPGRTRAVARLDTSEDAHLRGEGVWSAPIDLDDDDRSDIAQDGAVSMALTQIVATLSARAAARSDGALELPAV